MTAERARIGRPRRIAAKFLGGFVPAVAYHFGVLDVLRDRGFVLQGGFREPGEVRRNGPPNLDLVVGSSAGAFFVVAACAGIGREELVGAIEREAAGIAPFQARYLGESQGLTRKMWQWLRSGSRPPWRSRRTWKSWAAESTLNAIFPLWDLHAMERYLAEGVLRGRSWSDLRTEAAILAVDLNHPVTYIVGEREDPILALFREQPVAAEAIHLILGSEGHKIVGAFSAANIPTDHPALAPFQAEPWHRNTWLRITGVPMANAAVGSMAAYPFYAPVRFVNMAGKAYRLGHYEVVVEDGEDRDPFTTDVADEAGADLVIVSSIGAPYKYLHGLGSLAVRGFGAVHHQKTAQSRDAKQEDVMRTHRRERRLYEASRSILERRGFDPEALQELHEAFQRLAWIDHVRLRITPDPDIAAENRILRALDPLAFTPEAVARAYYLGRRVAERVLSQCEFEFL
jgi:predicted acylesterase/phospholipase RssA